MHPTNPHEIATIIDKSKIRKAPGPDRMSAKTIKSGKSAISNILSGLINQSIVAGCYPDSLKKAVVIPIHKKDEKDNPNNYRPISHSLTNKSPGLTAK